MAFFYISNFLLFVCFALQMKYPKKLLLQTIAWIGGGISALIHGFIIQDDFWIYASLLMMIVMTVITLIIYKDK